jgi:pilus assembly protein CpaB
MQSLQPKVEPQVELRSVVVAVRLIPPHTKITPDMLQVTQVSVDRIDPDAFSDTKQIVGKVSLIALLEAGQITHSEISVPADLGLTASLKVGERAISIPIDRVKDVSGLIQPGDRVDILAIPPRVDNTLRSYAILRDIRILALGTTTEQNTGASPGPDFQNAGTATLAVTPQQASLLAAADLNTTLRFTLRSPLEAANSLPPEILVFPTPRPAPTEKASPSAKDCISRKIGVIEGDQQHSVCDDIRDKEKATAPNVTVIRIGN